jgi:transcriptional regulator with XRE-family HTH domain
MSLQDVFIANLKKIRKQKKLSQMKLAERCNTAASYIGEIEIGRKFPSITMIEKIAGVLDIEAYRLFVDEALAKVHNEKAAAYFASLSPEFQQELIGAIMQAINKGLITTLKPENESLPAAQKRPAQKKGAGR